jgi:hypothetical protein
MIENISAFSQVLEDILEPVTEDNAENVLGELEEKPE